ncbi:MAG: hypothetical protein ACI4LI_02180 [Candidatus Fimenecus sp.]
MANFESGVKGYINGTATVRVHFPVDFHGNADISCRQCPFFSPSRRTCQLNKAICEYPEKNVGSQCPLELEAEENDD